MRKDADVETIWASLDQIATLFGRDKSVISRHIKNIFKEEELREDSTVAFFATVQKEGKREVKRNIEHFNLDMILSVGYRVNSKTSTQFRIWANKVLKEHITQGFSINTNSLKENHQAFLNALEQIDILTKKNTQVATSDILGLIKSFSYTWFSLDRYDRGVFPSKGSENAVHITAEALEQDLEKLKQELIIKGEATELFAQEKQEGSLSGILGSVFQTAFGEEVYKTVQDKAAHLMYFIIKNHPFNDGNKRSGAFCLHLVFGKGRFLIFKSAYILRLWLTLTILIAESNPSDEERMIGVILLLLEK